MKMSIIFLFVLLTSNAVFAGNNFYQFNGNYSVVSAECPAEFQANGHCAFMVYATQVSVAGDSSVSVIKVFNPTGSIVNESLVEGRFLVALDCPTVGIWTADPDSAQYDSYLNYNSCASYPSPLEMKQSYRIEKTNSGLRLIYIRKYNGQTSQHFILNLEKQ